jgi:hypothetical protein
MSAQGDYQINVIGHPWCAIDDYGNGAGYGIRNAGTAKPIDDGVKIQAIQH